MLRIVPERIHTMIPGLMILEGVIECFGCKRIEISRYGVRRATCLKMYSGERRIHDAQTV